MDRPPSELGRGVVVDQGSTIPSPWGGADVVVIDDGALEEPEASVAGLRRAWAERIPVVVALAVDPARFRPPPTWTGEVWRLRADLRLWHEELQWLVWSNTYDARGDGPPVWWWGRKALRLGATALPEGGVGDVVVDGVGPVWVDGGPRQPWPEAPAGLPVVHRDSVERSSLRPAPAWRAPSAALAPDQLAAVAHDRGPARIIAPAGSGKTRVLTERLAHLVGDRGWERDGVLAVAYNKKAQEEIEARCGALRPRARTLNSLGLWVITEAWGRPPAVIAEREARDIVRDLAPRAARRANTDPIAPYLEALGRVRLALVDPDQVEAERDDVPGLAAMVPAYRSALADRRAVDFDEQIYGAVEVLLADGGLRARLQPACRHLLVDELQDLTPAHVLLLRLLAGPGADVFGVGDDDQVIYGHAGADPGFLIDYADLFPGAASHPLEVNFRCPPEVVAAATSLLSYNHRRVPKVIRAGRAEDGSRLGVGPAVGVGAGAGAAVGAGPAVDGLPVADGLPVGVGLAVGVGAAVGDGLRVGAGRGGAMVVRRHPAGAGAAAVATEVGAWLDEGAPPGSIAVLARVRSALLAPVVALGAAGIGVDTDLGPEILERTGLRAALAYLRIATAPEGAIAAGDIVEVLRRPSRGLPQWIPDRLRRRSRWSLPQLRAIGGTVEDKVAAKLERLASDLDLLRGLAGGGAHAGALLAAVRDDVDLGGAMGLLDSSGREGSSHLDDLEALVELAALHPDPEDLEGWVRGHLAGAAGAGGVVASTVHRVKGMEWDHVVVCGASAGLLPHRLADDEEEERRILHVAITRARQRLVVLGDAARPSPMLDELDGTAPHRSPGDVRSPARAAGAAGRRSQPGSRTPSGPRPVEARIGLAVTAAGGYAGAIVATDDEGAAIALESGAKLRVRWGEPVTVHGREALLAAPPDLAPEVAAAEAALRSWRTGRARADRVAPFIVCSDKVLRAIATARPADARGLRAIEGIGPAKLEAYGEEILDAVAAAGTSPVDH